MHRTSRLLLAAAALTLPGLAAACGDDDDTSIDSVAENIEDEARSAATELEDEARSAATEVEDAARTAATEAEQAIDDVAADAAELAVRNVAAQQGAEAFADAGYSIDDEGLACEATASDGLDSVSVDCTGTTDSGEAAELTGETTDLPDEAVVALVGSFTGTVDGTEVFTTDTLGG